MGGEFMIVETGSYENPEKVGYLGWINLEKKTIYEDLYGNLVIMDRREG
jgi:hypothetical protein